MALRVPAKGSTSPNFPTSQNGTLFKAAILQKFLAKGAHASMRHSFSLLDPFKAQIMHLRTLNDYILLRQRGTACPQRFTLSEAQPQKPPLKMAKIRSTR